jgi:hypothetical protein
MPLESFRQNEEQFLLQTICRYSCAIELRYSMKEATLVVYSDNKRHPGRWRGNIIDNTNGLSICRTNWVSSRTQAMLDGAGKALEQGYKVWLAGVDVAQPEHT